MIQNLAFYLADASEVVDFCSAVDKPAVGVSCRKTECTYSISCALASGGAFLFKFCLDMAVYQEGSFYFFRAQTVEPTAWNATQINVRLYIWIRCRQAVI